MGFWLLLILLVLLIASAPVYPYSRGWGYWPAGVLAGVLILWLIVLWAGWVAFAWPWAVVAPVA
jgi:hypothetical protein